MHSFQTAAPDLLSPQWRQPHLFVVTPHLQAFSFWNERTNQPKQTLFVSNIINVTLMKDL